MITVKSTIQYEVTCADCGSVLNYDIRDVRGEWGPGEKPLGEPEFIIDWSFVCPVCQNVVYVERSEGARDPKKSSNRITPR